MKLTLLVSAVKLAVQSTLGHDRILRNKLRRVLLPRGLSNNLTLLQLCNHVIRRQSVTEITRNSKDKQGICIMKSRTLKKATEAILDESKGFKYQARIHLTRDKNWDLFSIQDY